MAKEKNSCALAPRIEGDNSKLYEGLLELKVGRPVANLIYASYIQSGVAEELDSQGYKRNRQGQHSAKAVYEFFNIAKMTNEASDITRAKIELGAIDDNGERVNIQDLVDAADKVKKFNNKYTGLVASIYYNGKDFYYYVGQRDSSTIGVVNELNKNLNAWLTLKKHYSKAGVDIDEIARNPDVSTLFNPTTALTAFNNLKGIRNIQAKYLGIPNIELLLLLNPNNEKVKNLYKLYGGEAKDTKELATTIKGILNGTIQVTDARRNLVWNTINELKNQPGINIEEVTEDISKSTKEVIDSDSGNIEATLQSLEKEFNLNVSEIILRGKDKTLEEASAHALLTLRRRQKELQNKVDRGKADDAELETLKRDIRDIARAINGKHYYNGVATFLNSSYKKLDAAKKLIEALKEESGDRKQTAFNRVRIVRQIDDIINGYIEVIQALSNVRNLDSTVSLSSTELESIEESTKEILDAFKPLQKTVDYYKKTIMQDILISILGETLPDGTPTAAALNSTDLSGHMFDVFYSFSRSANPLIGAMGTITRDAQQDRDQEYNKIIQEIKQIHAELGGFKSTKFMYEKDNMHLISDIDWDAYNKAEEEYKQYLKEKGMSEQEISFEMVKWHTNNTEDRIVDHTNGRTERVPNSKYRKAFPKLTPAQYTYYTKMMALKGRLESLLDTRGRSLYRPPQVRRSLSDVVVSSKSAKNLAKGLLARGATMFKMTEDNPDNAEFNTIIQGEGFNETPGTYSGEIKRQIPIFYMNRLKDPGELMLDFSAAIQAEASTAINYSVMSEVLDIVEFMKDYINNDIPAVSTDEHGVKGESVINQGVAVLQQLCNTANKTGCTALMQSFIDSQYYGIKLRSNKKWLPLFNTLSGYTTIKALALNIKGAYNNYIVGEYQLFIEAIGGEFFSLKDYIWAHAKLLGDNFTKIPGKIWDLLAHTKGSYDVLIAEKFGFMPSAIQEHSKDRYHSNPLLQVLSSLSPIPGYTIGEHHIHYMTGYARLHRTKVLLKGKKISLYNAYEKTGDPKNPTLKLKDGVTDLYGNPLTEERQRELEENERHTVTYCNQSCHGAMSNEDMPILAQSLLGRSFLKFRRWMIETYARRYRKKHWDGTLHQMVEGYDRTAFKLIRNEAKAFFGKFFGKELAENALRWRNASTHEKANFRRAVTGWALMAILASIAYLLDDDDPDDDTLAQKYIRYFAKRGAFELLSTETGYVGIAYTGNTIVQSIIPAWDTVKKEFYLLTGLVSGDYNKEIYKHGEYKNKYIYNVGRYCIPYYKDIDKYYGEWFLNENSNDENVFDMSQILWR